jgi:Fe-Mn family superoxide dismutase
MRASLFEAKKEKIEVEFIPMPVKNLSPVMSDETVKVHHGKLYKKYVERYDSGEGDPKFNLGGAILHTVYFGQLQAPKSGNAPKGRVLELILSKFDTFKAMQEEFKTEAMKIQGSGWIYLDKKGAIKIVHNHEKASTDDILFIIDWWEHAWFLDYKQDKEKYLANMWRIIDWDKVETRL